MTAPSALLLAFLLCLGATGCQTTKPASAPDAPSRFVELHLISMPVALNLDSVPGADGFAVKVFAVAANEPKPVAISTGTLEILMYDGVLAIQPGQEPTPLHTWSFSAKDLRPYLFKSSIGQGYELVLPWKENRPAEKKITILARHLTPGGQPIYSRPSSIVVVTS